MSTTPSNEDQKVAEWMLANNFATDDRYESWEGFKGLWRHRDDPSIIVLHNAAAFFYKAQQAGTPARTSKKNLQVVDKPYSTHIDNGLDEDLRKEIELAWLWVTHGSNVDQKSVKRTLGQMMDLIRADRKRLLGKVDRSKEDAYNSAEDKCERKGVGDYGSSYMKNELDDSLIKIRKEELQ